MLFSFVIMVLRVTRNPWSIYSSDVSSTKALLRQEWRVDESGDLIWIHSRITRSNAMFMRTTRSLSHTSGDAICLHLHFKREVKRLSHDICHQISHRLFWFCTSLVQGFWHRYKLLSWVLCISKLQAFWVQLYFCWSMCHHQMVHTDCVWSWLWLVYSIVVGYTSSWGNLLCKTVGSRLAEKPKMY